MTVETCNNLLEKISRDVRKSKTNRLDKRRNHVHAPHTSFVCIVCSWNCHSRIRLLNQTARYDLLQPTYLLLSYNIDGFHVFGYAWLRDVELVTPFWRVISLISFHRISNVRKISTKPPLADIFLNSCKNYADIFRTVMSRFKNHRDNDEAFVSFVHLVFIRACGCFD